MTSLDQRMGINHRGPDVLVTEQFLDCSDIVTRFKKMRGERMPEGVATHLLHNPHLADGLLDCSLEHHLVNLMPAFFAGPGGLPR